MLLDVTFGYMRQGEQAQRHKNYQSKGIKGGWFHKILKRGLISSQILR